MTLRPKVITGPTVEPISATDAKLQAKIDTSAEDSLLSIYIAAAREYFEDAAAYTVHQQTLEITLDQWPGYSAEAWKRSIGYSFLELPRATPLISVTSIQYTDTVGNVSTMSPADYIVDSDSIPGRISLPFNGVWPLTRLQSANPIRIRYVAGIATASPVTEAPGAIKLPILMLVAGMYENRESEVVTEHRAIQAFAMQYGVEAFINRIRDRVAPSSY